MTYILEMQIGDPVLRDMYRNAIVVQNNRNNYQNLHKDSGFDLYIPNEIHFKPFDTNFVDFGIRCAAYKLVPSPQGSIKGMLRVPQPYYIYPRSSISKTNFRLANSVGIIDSGYRGNIIGAIDNVKQTPATLVYGIRLLQICMPDLSPFKVKIVSQLDTTKRGAGGFGSTGR
jgi:dUTP pyrophosphatase